MTTPKNKTIKSERSNRRVVSITLDGVVKMTVEGDPGDNSRMLVVNGFKIKLSLDKKLRINNVKGQNVVASIDTSLQHLTNMAGEERDFQFATDAQGQPTMEVSISHGVEHRFTWETKSGRALADNEWQYAITPPVSPYANAAIGRSRGDGKKEYWFYDAAQAEETTESVDEPRTVKKWMNGGVAAGRLRLIETVGKTGQSSYLYKAAYDERGRVIREITPTAINVYDYDQSAGKTLTCYAPNTKTVLNVVRFNKLNQVVNAVNADGRSVVYLYDEAGREAQMINGKVHSKKTYAPDGSWEKEEVFDDGSGRLSRIFYRELDQLKRTILDRVIEQSVNPSESSTRYSYDALGKVINRVDSLAPISAN